MFVIGILIGCLGQIDDNSLEAHSLTTDDAQLVTEATGSLSATAGEDGDWQLAIGDAHWSYHSPSNADLAEIAGQEVTVRVLGELDEALEISDADGVRFIATASVGEDGGSYFGRAVWRFGEALGKGVVTNAYDEDIHVTFREVVLEADDGEVILLPGEPTTVTIDGKAWRATVIAAYEPDPEPHAGCGTPDMLAIELVRTEADPGPALTRRGRSAVPVGMCG